MKLQRYWVNDLQCTYISDEHAHSRAEWCKSADVSALEAENERLRARAGEAAMTECGQPMTYEQLVDAINKCAAENERLLKLFEDLVDDLDSIQCRAYNTLNREQEKQ